LSVGDHSVHVSLVFHSNLQSTIPSVQFDVKLDSSVEQSMLNENSFSFRDALLVD
jgi:hypothetical protein